MKRKEHKCEYDIHNTTPVTKAFLDWQLDPDKQLLDYGVGLNLKQKYFNWLDEKFKVDRIGLFYRFTIPYINTQGKPLYVYVQKRRGKVFLTDDCKTIRDLKDRGFHFSAKRKRHIEYILKTCDVKIDKDALVCIATTDKFARQLHSFVQAMLLIDGLFTADQAEAESQSN